MRFLLGLAAGIAIICTAHSATSFPTVTELEFALHLSRGGQLPKDVQASDGMIYHAYYDGARELSDGKYAIIVRLGR